MKIKYLDGKRLAWGIKAGAHAILKKQEHLNKINVFPVPDADTGTNMAATMKNVVDNLPAEPQDIEQASQKIADSALEGGRGNSGVILAQFFYGLSKALKKHKKINTAQFAEAADSAKEHAYSALSQPKDGTILTVIKDWAENIRENSKFIHDFEELLTHSLEAAKKSLEKTRTKIEAMRHANVVDSGAQGFVYLLEGITNFIKRGHIKNLSSEEPLTVESVASTEILPEQITFRYCSECLIEGQNIDLAALRAQITPLGDSIVLAGSPTKARLHIHTNEPAQVFYLARQYGALLQQKAEDMLRQYLVSHNPHAPIALVCDSAADLPQEFIDQHNIHVVPVRVAFGPSMYIDKITITPEIFYSMMETEPQHPVTSQPAPADYKNLFSFLLTHYESLIVLTLPEVASGTYQNALRAAKEFPDRKISLIDSHSLSVTYGLVVRKAAELIAAGLAHDEVVKEVTRFTRRTQIFVFIPDLKFVIRGGRLGKAKGLVAKLFNVKPILHLDSAGMPTHYSQSFSVKGAIQKNLRLALDFARQKKNPQFVLAHVNNQPVIDLYLTQIKQELGCEPLYILPASPTLAAHAGIGAVGIGIAWSEDD